MGVVLWIILVAVDFSDITEKVLGQCKVLSKAMTAETYLVHVVKTGTEFTAYNYDSSVMISSIEPQRSLSVTFVIKSSHPWQDSP